MSPEMFVTLVAAVLAYDFARESCDTRDSRSLSRKERLSTSVANEEGA